MNIHLIIPKKQTKSNQNPEEIEKKKTVKQIKQCELRIPKHILPSPVSSEICHFVSRQELPQQPSNPLSRLFCVKIIN